jgi:2-phospho-L-lactate guanylyltransferase
VTVTRAGVVVPIRAFALGKARLAERLDPAERAALGRRLAEQVVGAASGLATLVVSSDEAVRSWAKGLHLDAIDDPGSLDAAAHEGQAWFAGRGCTRIVIAHGDLPFAATFSGVARDGSVPIVVAVPCHRDDGTPVLSVPTDLDFAFAYGPGSFRRHAAEARKLGVGFRVVRDPRLAFDVDLPDDLALLTPNTR